MSDPGRFQYVTKTPAPIVSMITFQGRVLVATTDGVYELKNNKLHPLEFVTIPPEPERLASKSLMGGCSECGAVRGLHSLACSRSVVPLV